jgi:TRAP-type C4-dicarboxylate transport system permease small subunit
VHKKFLQTSAEVITNVSSWIFRTSNVIALALMLIIFIDVFFRRLYLAVTGTMDLIEVFFCILCFLSFSYTWIKGDHINVEVFLEHLPPPIQKAIRLFSSVLGIFIFACLTYGSFKLAFASFQFGDVTVDLGFPRGIPQAVMVIGAILFLLQLIISVLFELKIIQKPDLYE